MKKGCLISIAVLFGLGLIGAIFGGSDEQKDPVASVDSTTVDDSAIKNESSQQEQEEVGWEYSSKKDEMTDKETRWASMTSDNSVEFDFPYNGGSYLNLSVRKSPKYGTDVYISITKGQFIAKEYDGSNKVSVRFDNEAAMTFTTNEAADGSSDMLFLNNPKKFIAKAKSAHTIKIQAQFYQEGNRVFTFTTTNPLKWD